ncbi:enoyl-CoA hydratase-related protein [Roseiterribacter gracilis]|uniref:Enoyl-CoA hydratase n=1 Tax=Roseiterribacter gracilis TaxID=2812848 RepID=A0A8S8X6G1_9PROT|nr:enoyl-CoA hydratase [Rhodospirillales bacterium TMPK1]
MPESLIQEQPAPRVTLLRINRPDARNAINLEVRTALAARLETLAADPQTGVVIITGDEKAFAAGADVKLLAERSSSQVAELALERLWAPVERFPKPMIAAVEGFALGAGCELAMHADMIIASESASFGLPEVKLGIMPGAGGTQRLVRAIGKFAAMRLLLTGDLFSGTRAFELGLASEVVAAGTAVARALELATQIAALPPLALRAIKQATLQGPEQPLDQALAVERRLFQSLFDTSDQKEGMKAFIEKRKPMFEGK